MSEEPSRLVDASRAVDRPSQPRPGSTDAATPSATRRLDALRRASARYLTARRALDAAQAGRGEGGGTVVAAYRDAVGAVLLAAFMCAIADQGGDAGVRTASRP